MDNNSIESGITTSIMEVESQNTESYLSRMQRWSHLIAHILALVAVWTVIWWINLLGGLSWGKGQARQVFNYHPLLMILGFCFMTVASLSFRHYTLVSRRLRKITHALSWTIALLCGAISLLAVFQSHNDADSGLVANMYSLHSWVGSVVASFYVIQWLVGLYAFGFGNPSWKVVAIFIHKYIGPVLYQGVALTILLGIQEKEGFIGCAYPVESIDWFPPFHFFEIPFSCRVSHFLGLVVFMTTAFTMFAIHKFPSESLQPQQQTERLL